jgi:DNA-binding LacI/PurR family transcriptional regulator
MYKEVAGRIRSLIEEDDLWGRFLAPERELAATFGVSRDTIRKGLDELQADGLITRKQGFGTQVRPRDTLQTGKAAGRLLVGCSAGHGAEFISGIAEVAGRAQWLSYYCSLVTPGGRSEFAARLSGEDYDGVVLLSVNDERLLREVREAWSGPLVLVDHHFPELEVTSVMEDCTGGVRRSVEHLAALGHRRIAYVGHSRRELNPWKEQGYAEGLERACLRLDRRLMARAAPTFEAGQNAGEQLLALREPPTAVVASSDRQAWGLWRAAELAGRTVGGDFALTGYGDTSEVASFGQGLTTVSFDPVELGRVAMNKTVELSSGVARPGELVLVPTRLVIRDSSKNAVAAPVGGSSPSGNADRS